MDAWAYLIFLSRSVYGAWCEVSFRSIGFFALVLSTFVVNLRTVHIYIVLWVQFLTVIAYNYCMIIKLTCINRHLQ